MFTRDISRRFYVKCAVKTANISTRGKITGIRKKGKMLLLFSYVYVYIYVYVYAYAYVSGVANANVYVLVASENQALVFAELCDRLKKSCNET